MKIILFVYVFISFLYPNEVVCVVPKNIKKQLSVLFSKKIVYNNMKVRLKGIESENTIRWLNESEIVKFAIVRRDIAWQIQQHEDNKQKDTFITLNQFSYKAQLSLIQKDTYVDLDRLSKKTISIGLLDDLDSYYLKALFDVYEMKYSVNYKSISYKKSLNALKQGKIDAYFTFLPNELLTDGLNIQTLFRKKTVKFFEKLGIFEIDYNGIFSPYILVVSLRATDEEIESMIYRLMDKEMFYPVTDRRYGTINEYVMIHLESVKMALYEYQTQKQKGLIDKKRNMVCRKYHYGFLKLLREKPRLKKYLKQNYSFLEQKKYIKKINSILVKLDEDKYICDLTFFSIQRKKFEQLQQKIANGS